MLEGIRKKRVAPELYNLLNAIYSHVPNIHHTDDNFMQGMVALEKFKIETSLKHILKMATASEHFFSHYFWQDMLQLAEKLKMPKLITSCNAGMQRSADGLAFKTPRGWSTQKIDNSHFKHHIAEPLNVKE